MMRGVESSDPPSVVQGTLRAGRGPPATGRRASLKMQYKQNVNPMDLSKSALLCLHESKHVEAMATAPASYAVAVPAGFAIASSTAACGSS
jgi:hypothetical protein